MQRAPYQDGVLGVRQSLSAMVRQIRADRGNPRVKGWAQNVLGAAGLDGRDNPSVKEQAQAILTALRKKAKYWPDPLGMEYVGTTEAILCLSPEQCANGDDCDGLTVAFCSACASVAIPVAIVHQKFGAGQQEHVLGAVKDERGLWLKCDPTLKDAPVGQGAYGVSWEQTIDPFEELSFVGAAGIREERPEIVTFGKAPPVGLGPGNCPACVQHNGKWWTPNPSGDGWLVHHNGMWLTPEGARAVSKAGLGAVGDTVTWILLGDRALPGVGPAAVNQAKAVIARTELQGAVFGLKSKLIDMRASLANLATVQGATGSAADPSAAGETGPSSFPRDSNGVVIWTAGVARYVQWLLSIGDSIVGVGEQALSGSRKVGIIDTVVDFLVEALPADAVRYLVDAATNTIQLVAPDGTALGTIDRDGNRQGPGVGLQGAGVGLAPLAIAAIVVVVLGVIYLITKILDHMTAETNQRAASLIAEAVANKSLDPDKAQQLLNAIAKVKQTDADAEANKAKNDPFARVTETAAGVLNTALVVGAVVGTLWVGKQIYDGIREEKGLKKLKLLPR